MGGATSHESVSKENQEGEKVNVSREFKDVEKITIGLLGDSCSGKTSLIERFMENHFPQSTGLTFLDRKEKSIVVRGKNVLLTILDMSGCYALEDTNKSYLKLFKLHGLLLVYDVIQSKNLEVVDGWIKYLRKINSEAEILLVGNKIDVQEPRAVSTEFVQQYAIREDLEFIECSAKSGENTNDVLERIVEKIFRKQGLLFSETDENFFLKNNLSWSPSVSNLLRI